MDFKYYLFDLDNCLIHYPNFIDFFDNVLIENLKNFSINTPPQKERKELLYSEEKHKDILMQWGISDCELFWKLFNEIDFKNRKKLIGKNEIFLFNKVKSVLQRLRDENKKLGLISNSPSYIVDYVIEKFSLNKYFDVVLRIDYNKNQYLTKPSPYGILSILDKLKYNSENSNAIMIGDSMVDIVAAKRANIYGCLIVRDSSKETLDFEEWEHNPDFIIYSLDDLLEL